MVAAQRIFTDRLIAPAGGLLLCAATLFGGASQGNALSLLGAELLSLPALALGLWLNLAGGQGRHALVPLLIVAAIILTPLVQLIPLAPSVWSGLPGRADVVAILTAAGVALPPMSLSLAPEATLHSALALAPPVGMFLITPYLPRKARAWLCLLLLGLVSLSVMLGIAQEAGGPSSALRFYAQTNIQSGVGFFANRNHQAAMLCCAILLAAAWVASAARRGGEADRMVPVLALSLTVVFAVGVVVSGSRAGLALAILAIVAGLAIIFARRARSPRLFAAAGGAALLLAAIFFTAQVARIPALEHFRDDAATDLRWQAAPYVLKADRLYWPVGAGVGTFIPVYKGVEPPALVDATIFNHAHNDYLELVIESGIFGCVIFVAFLVWWGRASIDVWRADDTSGTDAWARAGTGIVALLLLHSVVDYPLRTIALATWFAFACGLMSRLIPARIMSD